MRALRDAFVRRCCESVGYVGSVDGRLRVLVKCLNDYTSLCVGDVMHTRVICVFWWFLTESAAQFRVPSGESGLTVKGGHRVGVGVKPALLAAQLRERMPATPEISHRNS